MFDHKAEAEEWLNYSGNLNSEATPEQVIHANGMAQVHATLYAAEQQRIANLLAVAALAPQGERRFREIDGWAEDAAEPINNELSGDAFWGTLLGRDSRGVI